MSCHRQRLPFCLLTGYGLGLLLVVLLVTGCDYARMTDDEAVNTYQTELPAMPEHTVPVDGGTEGVLTSEPRFLVNPQPFTPSSIEQGRLAYGYYCVPCHGPKADGQGTVGQSFSPLPANLTKDSVQAETDGELFAKTSLGFKRCPPLAQTVAEKDRWAIINYLRSLTAVPTRHQGTNGSLSGP